MKSDKSEDRDPTVGGLVFIDGIGDNADWPKRTWDVHDTPREKADEKLRRSVAFRLSRKLAPLRRFLGKKESEP